MIGNGHRSDVLRCLPQYHGDPRQAFKGSVQPDPMVRRWFVEGVIQADERDFQVENRIVLPGAMLLEFNDEAVDIRKQQVDIDLCLQAITVTANG